MTSDARDELEQQIMNGLMDGMPRLGTGMNTSTFTEAQAKAMTMADLNVMIEAVEKLGEEPIGKWMRQNLAPPELYAVVIPASMKPADGPDLWPSYVHFSASVQSPVFVRRIAPLITRRRW